MVGKKSKIYFNVVPSNTLLIFNSRICWFFLFSESKVSTSSSCYPSPEFSCVTYPELIWETSSSVNLVILRSFFDFFLNFFSIMEILWLELQVAKNIFCISSSTIFSFIFCALNSFLSSIKSNLFI